MSRRTKRSAIATVYVALLAFDIWLFFFLAGGDLEARIAFCLQVLGLYAIATTLLEQTGLLAAFAQSADELTSPSLLTFVAANLTFAGLLMYAASLAVTGVKYARGWYALVATPVSIVAALVLVVLVIAYLVVVMPLAYLAYLIASVFLVGITANPGETVVMQDGERLELRKTITSNLAKLRSFLVGAPTIVLTVLSSGAPVF
jgi:hypothetical protein